MDTSSFVNWFRGAAPYINACRKRIFVIVFGGEVIADARFPNLIHDIVLLNSLGVRLLLVHGTRPQIEQRLAERGTRLCYVNGLRITDEAALICVKEAAGSVRVEIEALLSMGLANTPTAGSHIRVATGNFVTAQPLGIRDGVDYLHTGEVRHISSEAITQRLDSGDIVLISPLGYSPTGEVFNLSAEDVATAAATQLQADKLIHLIDAPGITSDNHLMRELDPNEAEALLSGNNMPDELARTLSSAVYSCRNGVRRAHLIDRNIDGGLLLELFTRDGIGTLITADDFEGMRQAVIDDVGGILELISPLEKEGILVRRSRELLEMEIGYFTVIERDNAVIGCAALYPFVAEGIGELACLAIHPDYRDQGRGDALLKYVERGAHAQGLGRMIVLTSRTAHWFLERGFEATTLGELPVKRQLMYNYQRRSKVFIKRL